MKAWAVIVSDLVINTVIAERDLHATHGGDKWVDITDLDPMPQKGWTYDSNTNTFTPPQE